MDELSPGTDIAGYTIEAKLGVGGMGIVYRARHPKLPRSDALKILNVLPERQGSEDETRARFLREADLAASLSHPHIVTVYDRGETEDKSLWIAMQLVEGSDSEREMKAGRMPPQRVLKILADVGSALDYAHRRKILHRDVKPANFLLAEDDDRTYLADFGIARALDDVSSLTKTGTVMASIPFIAPESLRGGGVEVDYRADIYSLGCSAFQLLTGHVPFFRAEKDGVAAVMGAHLLAPPPKVTELAPGLPAAIDVVMAKVLAKDPAQRYQTASEFAAAARQAITTGTAPGSATFTQPWASGHGPGPSAAAAPLMTGPGGGFPGGQTTEIDYPSGYFSGPNAHGRHGVLTAPPVAPRRGRRRMALIIGAVTMVLAVAVVAGVMLLRSPSETPYVAQSFTHVHGSTEVSAAPRAVATLGPGDADAVLSLNVQPVAMIATSGLLPSWEQSQVTSKPTVLASIDTAAVAAAHPDLIIATGDIDDSTFNKLKDIAPTVTRPADKATEGWDWQAQLSWVGKILGKESTANDRINAIRSAQADLVNQHPRFKGKTVEALTVSDTGVAQVLSPSFTVDYLESLGFRYSQDLTRTAADTTNIRPLTDLNRIYQIETDYLIVIRTDSAAHGGGYAGLPKQLATFSGKMVIVDDPNTVAALTGAGGYLVTRYLDDHVVNAISSA